MPANPANPSVKIPDIQWAAKSHFHTWRLVSEIENNRKAILGPEHGENTTGERKQAALRGIAQRLFPDSFALNSRSMEDRIVQKTTHLFKTYKKHVARLHQTGGGIGGGNGVDEYAACYIGVDGPDATTTQDARNIWESIENDFPFFPRLHRLLATRSNMRPPALTTGIGPEGRKVVHLQPPEDLQVPPVSYAPAPIPILGPDPHGFNNIPDPDPCLIDPAIQNDPATVRPALDTHDANTDMRRHSQSLSATNVSDKENVVPPSFSRPPKPPSFGNPSLAAAVQKAEESITRTPAKRPFEDRLVELHEKNLGAAQERAAEENAMKRQKMSLQKKDLVERQVAGITRQLASARHDYDDGLMNRDEYQQLARELRAQSMALLAEAAGTT